MKRKLAVIVALSAAGSCANAQTPAPSSVQLYGVLDAGVEYVNNVSTGRGHVTRMPGLSGGQLPSRWGLRGTEDLGGGLRAVYTLESGFAVDSGVALQGGRAFGRQSFVGLSGDWGTLTLGRHWTMSFYSMLDADVFGPSVFGLATFDPYLPNARTDNSISYRGTFSGMTVGATYSLGRDGAAPANCSGENAAHECRAWSVLAKYDAPRWGVAVAHDKLESGATGGFFGQPPGTTPNASNTDARTHLNGYVRVGDAKVGGGLIRRKLRANPTPLSTDLYYLGVSTPVAGPFSVDAQLIAIRDDRPNANAKTVVVRGNYAFSRRTSAYAMLGHVSNGSNAAYSVTAGEAVPVGPAAGRGQTGVMLGLRHSF
ncbi:porin [Rhodoferax ferrireducens]|uniref:porin n=1 Tax=Rhodoferax ferrireducens TaxID=192843 RepID=UPI000E0E04AE|nr:porin [Rhodoferax ferrireducens]